MSDLTPEETLELQAMGDEPDDQYWHVGAEVYPDGSVENRWEVEHSCDEPGMEPVDSGDRLFPFPGHAQGHCGWHVSVFGSDLEATRADAQRQVDRYVAMANGTCECGKTGDWMRNFRDTITREVTLIGGPNDGDITQVEGDARWDPCPDGLIVLHGTPPDGLQQSWYGPICRDGDGWARTCTGTKPVEFVSGGDEGNTP